MTYLFRCLFFVLVLAPTSFAHEKLGAGSYPLDTIRPEVIAQVEAMTKKTILELAKEESHDPKYRPLAEYIENSVNRLMKEPKNQVFFKNVPRIRVHVLPSKEINAFAMASGDIYVYLGIVPYMKHQNMLTAVLAHELIHVSRAHVPRLINKYWDQIPHDNPKITLDSYTNLLNGGNSTGSDLELRKAIAADKRASETEADDIGCELLDNADVSAWYFKFSMQAMKRFVDKHEPTTSSKKLIAKLLDVFADHPPTEDRISRSDAELHRHNYRDFRTAGPDGSRRKKEMIDPKYAEIYEMAKSEVAKLRL